MIEALISILIVALVLFVVWWAVGLLVKNGTIMNVIGIVLGLVLLLYALDKLGVGGRFLP